MWAILSILFIVITIYVHKHSYKDYISYDRKKDEYKFDEKDRFKLPLWLFLIGVILLLIPILNIILFIAGVVWYILNYCDNSIYFSPSGIMKKIINFFNKDL